jgi:hypothetical protein
MNDKEKLQLQQMITENNVEDQTGLIRELKHSVILREEINQLVSLKSKCENEEDLNLEGMIKCNFLFTYYTDIYNKVRKDEIDYTILFQFLDVLKKIEDGLMDQHEGSFEVGTLLKKLYVDSAIRKADKINEKYENEQDNAVDNADVVDISWKKFKAMIRK